MLFYAQVCFLRLGLGDCSIRIFKNSAAIPIMNPLSWFMIPQSWPMAGFETFLTYLFLPQEEEKMKQMLNTLNISDFISKCTIYIYNSYITELSTWLFLCN